MTGTPLSPDQRKIRELEKRITRIELEKEILKKVTLLGVWNARGLPLA